MSNRDETWYESTNAGTGQGLVISESTGANICVTYEQKDAKPIVDLHNACLGIETPAETVMEMMQALLAYANPHAGRDRVHKQILAVVAKLPKQ